MRCAAFELVGNTGLEAIDADDAFQRAQDHDGAFWFDVHSYTKAELEDWLRRLDLPEVSVSIATGGGPLQMISLPDHAIAALTVFADEDGSQVESVGAVVTNDVLITLHPRPLAVESPADEILDAIDVTDLSPSRLLILVLVLRAQHTQRVATTLWDRQSELDDKVEEDVASVKLGDIRAQKLAVARLARVTESQIECFEFLAGAESNALAVSRHPGNIAQLVDAARSTRREADRLKEEANDLRTDFELHQQSRMTHRLNVLTVVTTVFVPLTFLAGIWGMNFENMPGLSATYGYLIALTTMALIAGLLLRYFHRTGWFD